MYAYLCTYPYHNGIFWGLYTPIHCCQLKVRCIFGEYTTIRTIADLSFVCVIDLEWSWAPFCTIHAVDLALLASHACGVNIHAHKRPHVQGYQSVPAALNINNS